MKALSLGLPSGALEKCVGWARQAPFQSGGRKLDIDMSIKAELDHVAGDLRAKTLPGRFQNLWSAALFPAHLELLGP